VCVCVCVCAVWRVCVGMCAWCVWDEKVTWDEKVYIFQAGGWEVIAMRVHVCKCCLCTCTCVCVCVCVFDYILPCIFCVWWNKKVSCSHWSEYATRLVKFAGRSRQLTSRELLHSKISVCVHLAILYSCLLILMQHFSTCSVNKGQQSERIMQRWQNYALAKSQIISSGVSQPFPSCSLTLLYKWAPSLLLRS